MKRASQLSYVLRALSLFALFASLAQLRATPAHAALAITVNSLNDPGSGGCNPTECTLREAITSANDSPAADIILFSVNGKITLGSALPAITSAGGALTINATGRNIEVGGADAHRPFSVNSSAKLTLINLDVSDGYVGGAGVGGGVYNAGTLIIQDSLLLENRAGADGGGIYSSGALTMTHTALNRNSTVDGNGGGLYVYQGKVFISDSSFQGNSANYSGGAIYNRYQGESQGGDLTIQRTTFYTNTASGGNGGAIANESLLKVSQSQISGNFAEEYGGGIHNSGGEFQIQSSQLHDNRASFHSGGAIYALDSNGACFVKDSTLSENTAGEDGGGFYFQKHNGFAALTIERTRIEQNEAGRDGGGGFNWDGMVYLNHSTFDANHADHDGGGFYNNDNMRIQYSTLANNTADNFGGGVYHSASGASVTLRNSTFYQNSAASGGGAYMRSTATFTNCTFSSNSASTVGGGGGLNRSVQTFVRNSIIANSPSGGNCSAPPTNEGNNIDNGITCGWGSNQGSMSSTLPRLETLRDNGGWTKTMAPQAISPAIDGVAWNSPNECPADDQRGYLRPYGVRCDIGAFERYWQLFMPLVKKNN